MKGPGRVCCWQGARAYRWVVKPSWGDGQDSSFFRPRHVNKQSINAISGATKAMLRNGDRGRHCMKGHRNATEKNRTTIATNVL